MNYFTISRLHNNATICNMITIYNYILLSFKSIKDVFQDFNKRSLPLRIEI